MQTASVIALLKPSLPHWKTSLDHRIIPFSPLIPHQRRFKTVPGSANGHFSRRAAPLTPTLAPFSWVHSARSRDGIPISSP